MSITGRVCELYRQLLSENNIAETDIVSLQISITPDLTELNPATALRLENQATDVPLFCCAEPWFKKSPEHIIRFLLTFYQDEHFKAKPVYLHEAASLRTKALTQGYSEAHPSKLWLVTREYAGLAEAGGLKNVVKSLAEHCEHAGIEVTVFLPYYSFMQPPVQPQALFQCRITVLGKEHCVSFYTFVHRSICFILISADIFSDKQSVYTYTAAEAAHIARSGTAPHPTKGTAYSDTHEMNMIFQKAVVEYAVHSGTIPNIVHCHDGHTALVPAFFYADTRLQRTPTDTRFFVTIHNAGDLYRQEIWTLDYAQRLTELPADVLTASMVAGNVEPFLIAAQYAKLTTVSPWYADELHSAASSPFSENFAESIVEKNIKITGITNGIDYKLYDPANTEVSCLPYPFDPIHNDFTGKYKCRKFFLDVLNSGKSLSKTLNSYGSLNTSEENVYLLYHGRIVHQKGISILLNAIAKLCGNGAWQNGSRCRFVIMGQGTADLEQACIDAAAQYAGRVLYLQGYDKKLARLVTAASDFILLPSLFEPCGLEDFISQIYGTIPIAHKIGGLQKIIDGKTGFLFQSADPQQRFNAELITDALCAKVKPLVDDFFQSIAEHVLDIAAMQEIITQANKTILKDYNWDKVSNRYFQLYKE